MNDERSLSLARTLDLAVLLVVVGAVLTGVALVDAGSNVARRQLERFSWAEERCEGLVPPGQADSEERWACVKRELAKSDWEAVGQQLAWMAMGGISIVGGVVLHRRRRREGSDRFVESSEGGPA